MCHLAIFGTVQKGFATSAYLEFIAGLSPAVWTNHTPNVENWLAAAVFLLCEVQIHRMAHDCIQEEAPC
jgi:hypothetical protein